MLKGIEVFSPHHSLIVNHVILTSRKGFLFLCKRWLNVLFALCLQVCTPCPAGSFCPNITASPIDCPDGSYSLGFATSCIDCPAGHYCQINMKGSVPLPCPAGQYSNKSATACTPCDAGYACKGSDITPRPPSGLCPMGYFCPDGLREDPCPSGTFGNVTGAASQAAGCPACPAGYYCPAGTRGYPSHRFVCLWCYMLCYPKIFNWPCLF